MKNVFLSAMLLFTAFVGINAQETNNDNYMDQKLNLTQEWDKTFPLSDKVEHKKVTFHNHFGLTLAADMYIPKKNSLPSPLQMAGVALENYLPLPYADLSELLRSRQADSMRRQWQSADSLQ